MVNPKAAMSRTLFCEERKNLIKRVSQFKPEAGWKRKGKGRVHACYVGL